MKHKSEDYKITAVQYYLTNKEITRKGICNIFKCSIRSLDRWISFYKENETLKNKLRDCKAYKVRQEYVEFISNEIKNNKTVTMKEIQYSLQDKFNVTISRFHVSRIVKDNGFTLKLVKVRHEPNTRYNKIIDIKSELKIFYKEIAKINIDDIICIDETSLSSKPLRTKGYSKIGKRCFIKTHVYDVFKKFTGIFAISNKGIIDYKIYDKGGITVDRLTTFLNPILNKYKNKVIILDNAPVHKSHIVKTLIFQKHKLLYTVPYQHYTNAIENFFSMLKSHIHKYQGLTVLELKNDIKNILNKISQEKYNNILNGTYKRIINYKNKSTKIRGKTKKYL